MSTYPDDCPVAATLDAVGDRWTLLVVRDLLRGITRYGDLARSLAPIAPNLLAGRLRRLEDLGLVTRERYSDRPLRASYELTERGRALAPVIITLGRFGIDHLNRDLPAGDRALECARPGQDRRSRMGRGGTCAKRSTRANQTDNGSRGCQ